MAVDEERFDDAVAWWLRELGPAGETLVLPIDAHFGDAKPEGIFAAVVRFADLESWPFVLEDASDAVLANPMQHVPHPEMVPPVLRSAR